MADHPTRKAIQAEIDRLLSEAAAVPVGTRHSMLVSRAAALAMKAIMTDDEDLPDTFKNDW